MSDPAPGVGPPPDSGRLPGPHGQPQGGHGQPPGGDGQPPGGGRAPDHSAAPDTGPLPGRRGPLFWISAAAGWAVIGWGVRGIMIHRLDTRPADLARFFVAGAAIHDLVFAPLVLVAGVAVGRLAPRQWRSYVQGALMVSGLLVLFSYPEVRGFAHGLHNPTSLPHNYAANLSIAVGAVWVIAAAMALVTVGRRRRAAR